jgi:DNA sulfur modification protein DndE
VKALAALAMAAVLAAGGGGEKPTLFLVGDSTMADKPDPDRNPERGWGQLLPRFLDDSIEVRNHAVNGRSSKSFIDEGRWAAVLAELGPGDCVLVQFGHNDEKREDPARYAAPRDGYRRNLLRFVAEAREKGADVVIVSPIVRRRFSAAGALEDTHGEYPAAAREVAMETGAPFIDLRRLSEELVAGAGPEGSKAFYVWLEPGRSEMYPEGRRDDTHLSVRGAAEVARLAAEALRRTGLPIARHVRLGEQAGHAGSGYGVAISRRGGRGRGKAGRSSGGMRHRGRIRCAGKA